ncbi:MAG: hypothetical protein MJ169_04880 [Treponema sp.]|nr:hypothetical protein [Treponema sp.]
MVSIDQVLLLQQKVESAVQKIVQLKAENDALRSKCSGLTNALSENTELLATHTAEEKKIEDSISKTIDRLSCVDSTGSVTVNAEAESVPSPSQPVNNFKPQSQDFQTENISQNPIQAETEVSAPEVAVNQTPVQAETEIAVNQEPSENSIEPEITDSTENTIEESIEEPEIPQTEEEALQKIFDSNNIPSEIEVPVTDSSDIEAPAMFDDMEEEPADDTPEKYDIF